MLELALYVRHAGGASPAHDSAAQRYIDLAEHICAKWEARGTWREFGRYGGYVSWDHFLTPEDLDRFQVRDDVRNTGRKTGLGLPFNKQQSMGIVHLRLYRLTGSAEHRRKAQLIFQYAKSRLSAFEDQFTWNYWEPFYPGDVVSVEPSRLAHWVNTHPYRNYQQGEVSEFVEAFHSGIVFTAADMERLVRTNLRMWNGDVDDPEWANSNEAANRAAVPTWVPPEPAQGYDRLAGTLWRALAPFDSTLARLAGIEASNTDYRRRYDLPVTQVTFLQLGCVLPPTASRGDTVLLVSKARAPGRLDISVGDGSTAEIPVWSGSSTGGLDGLEGVTIRAWRVDADAGDYRVRWTFEVDGHREVREDLLAVR
jgi:hypothetical protein